METDVCKLIDQAMEKDISDLHMTAGQKLFYRRGDRLLPWCEKTLSREFLHEVRDVLLTKEQQLRLTESLELDFSQTIGNRRIRGNAYLQRGELSFALRMIPEQIPSLEDLGTSPALLKLLNIRQGFLLVTGRTGSGKSTTLAAFLKKLMEVRSIHLLTLEDPIEFLHSSGSCFISQRELGKDFLSFPGALKHALREMPDVILVGEIRDTDTLQLALEAASTGVFVLGTLHTKSAAETVMRVESMFPLEQRAAIRDRFADVFSGIFSQALLPSSAAGERVCATEVLLANPASRNLIRQSKFQQIQSVMMSSPDMNTMETAVKELFRHGQITESTMKQYFLSGM